LALEKLFLSGLKCIQPLSVLLAIAFGFFNSASEPKTRSLQVLFSKLDPDPLASQPLANLTRYVATSERIENKVPLIGKELYKEFW